MPINAAKIPFHSNHGPGKQAARSAASRSAPGSTDNDAGGAGGNLSSTQGGAEARTTDEPHSSLATPPPPLSSTTAKPTSCLEVAHTRAVGILECGGPTEGDEQGRGPVPLAGGGYQQINGLKKFNTRPGRTVEPICRLSIPTRSPSILSQLCALALPRLHACILMHAYAW